MPSSKPKVQKSSIPDPQSPKQNRLLAALPATAYRRLLPYLEPVTLPHGQILFPPMGKMHYAYFPTTSIVGLSYAIDKGVSANAWPVGSEGVVGLAWLTGPVRNERAAVQIAGHAFRLPVRLLRSEFTRGGSFQQLMLRYLLALIAQGSQFGVCNRIHSLDQRLCRFLLRAFDRAPTNELAITQQRTADLLGVRRVSVTEAAGRLQTAGIIRCDRGHVTLLSRRKLKAGACPCYAVIKKAFDGLLAGWRRTARRVSWRLETT